MKINRNNRRKQRGIALLFALGVLSLLLIMGLASVTNALLAQRVASNNSSRSQAKMLAQSAISRMAISLMYYQYQVSNASTPFIPSSYNSIYSLYDSTGTSTNTGATDGLRDSSGDLGSKLRPPANLMPTDFADDPRAQWSYVTAKDSSGTRIIGRMAYQLVPSTGSINLDHVLRGIFTQATPTPSRIPWNVRWGIGINELNLNSSTVFSNWASSYAPSTESEMTASNFSAFFTAYGNSLFNTDTAVREKWVRRWFCEGTVPADPEYYYYEPSSGSSEFYHRFNLGVLDSSRTVTNAWYDRLVNTDGSAVTANSDTAVEHIAKNSVGFKLTDELTPLASASSTRIGGLPFLKYIGNSIGSFADITARRKQIAASLNDYCDLDSIPTSDVLATTWSSAYNQANTSWPTYTGNEKTPYINELAFGFKIAPTLTAGSGGYSSSNVIVNVAMSRAELIAELIRAYQNFINTEQHATENLNAYQLLAHLKSLNLAFRVTVNGTLNYTDGTTPGTATLSNATVADWTITYADQGVTVNFNPYPSDATLQPAWSSGGYLAYAGVITAPATANHDFDFSTAFNGILPSGNTVTSAVINEVKIEVLNPKFTMGGVALMDVADPGSEFGVDFVRWTDVELPTTNKTLELFNSTSFPSGDQGGSGAGWIKASSLASIDKSFFYFYLGGMEVKDPRQNLNAVDTTDVALTDWSFFANIDLVEFDNATPAQKLTMTIAAPTGADPAVKARITAGLVNTDSNPNAKTVSGGTAYDAATHDVETVTDPAWVNDTTHLSTAYVHNAPMRSLWELGAIHRAAAWETINLKTAMQPGSTTTPISPVDMALPTVWSGTGTLYAGGDGGLLEQVKMTDKAYCYGKVNVNMLSSDTTVNKDYTALDKEIGRALFTKVYYGQSLSDLDDATSTPGTEITWAAAETAATNMQTAVSYFSSKVKSRSQFLCWSDSSGNSYANGFGIISSGFAALPDARQEELIGKTIDLVKAKNTMTNTLRFVVVAQTIRDVGDSSTSGIPVVRIDYAGDAVPKSDCKWNVFDVASDGTAPTDASDDDKFIYYDQITGEVKMLVTMENNPVTGQTIVRQIEYIE